MSRRALLRLVPVLAALALAPACLSPTLPLPPPDAPDTVGPVAGTTDMFRVSGTCTPGTRVTVFDETTGRGVVYDDRDQSGRYDVTIPASACDTGSLAQEIVGDPTSESASTRFVFQETKNSLAIDPGACR